MGSQSIQQCQCWECQEGNETTRLHHEQLNLLMSRLNEQQRRWLAALEAKRLGHGGTQRLSEITGLDINTIRRGRRELDAGLAHRPVERVRVAGGGRKRVEKTSRSRTGVASDSGNRDSRRPLRSEQMDSSEFASDPSQFG